MKLMGADALVRRGEHEHRQPPLGRRELPLACVAVVKARIVAEHAPGRDLLRRELAEFVFKPGAQGRLRLEAARGHDDLVIAAALAVLAADLAASRTSQLFGDLVAVISKRGASLPSHP